MHYNTLKLYMFTLLKGALLSSLFLADCHISSAAQNDQAPKRKFGTAFPNNAGPGIVSIPQQTLPSNSFPTDHPIVQSSPTITQKHSPKEKEIESHQQMVLEKSQKSDGLPTWFVNICQLLITLKTQEPQQALNQLEQLSQVSGALPQGDITNIEPRLYWNNLHQAIREGQKETAIKTLSTLIFNCTVDIIQHTLHQNEINQQYIIPKDLHEIDILTMTEYNSVQVQQRNNINNLTIRNKPLNTIGHPNGQFMIDNKIFTLQNVDGISMRCFFNAIGLDRLEEIKKLISSHSDPVVRYMIANEIVSAAANPEQFPEKLKEAIEYAVYQFQMEHIQELQEERSNILLAQEPNANKQDTSVLSEVHKNIGALSDQPLEELRKRAFTLKAFNAFILHYISNDEMMVALHDVTGDIGGNINANYTSIDAIAYINNIAIKIYQQNDTQGELRLAHQYIPQHATELAYLYHQGAHFQALVLKQQEEIESDKGVSTTTYNFDATREVIQILNKLGALPGKDITGDENFWGRILSQITKKNADIINSRLFELKKKIHERESIKKEHQEVTKEHKVTPIELYTLNPTTQPEEKWRWRNSFNLIYHLPEKNKPLIMDFSSLHHQLSEIRRKIENLGSKYMKTDSPNVLVPAITIVYETNSGDLEHKSEFLPYYGRSGIAENKYLTFLSGLGAKDLPENVSFMDQTFYPTKGDSFPGMGEPVMKEDLKILYQINSESTDPLNQFRKFILNHINNPSYTMHGANFGTYFYHSEQWFIFHLVSPIPRTFIKKYTGKFIPTRFGNLCLAILNVVKSIPNIKTVHEIIFHAESTHDICDVCSPTLAVFIDQLNNSRTQLISSINQINTTHFKKDDLKISEQMRFFMITSAYRPDNNQAHLRNYYNTQDNRHKDKRREFFGKDKVTNQDHFIEITPEIPYLYVQVPVDNEGRALKSISK